MSILDKIAKPTDGPVISTVTGDAGIGKTSLAATFPNPIFIRVEDGLQSIPYDKRPDAFPVIRSPDDLWEQCSALIKEEHNYQTAVVDSVTKLDPMFISYIMNHDPKNPASINQAMGGYGAGRAAVAELHYKLRRAAGLMAEKRGMNVVFIAHSDIQRIERPDEEAYTRYDIRLHEKSAAPYIDDVHMVAYVRLETYVMGAAGESKKAISNGGRIVTAHAVAANISKNRYGITENLPFELGINPFLDHIPQLRGN